MSRREITLKTWGNRLHRKRVPFATDHNFNVTGISDVKPRVDLREIDGRSVEIQRHVASQPATRPFTTALSTGFCNIPRQQ